MNINIIMSRALLGIAGIAQTSKSAVSWVFKPAGCATSSILPTWKSAIQQVWKPALRHPGGLRSTATHSSSTKSGRRWNAALRENDSRSLGAVNKPSRLSMNPPSRAFTLIELIGVLAVIAILAAILVPSLVRKMDVLAGQQESAILKSYSDALQQSIMRNRYIPAHTNWVSVVATELGMDVAKVTTNTRNQPRI